MLNALIDFLTSNYIITILLVFLIELTTPDLNQDTDKDEEKRNRFMTHKETRER